jgi:hypothetical protein
MRPVSKVLVSSFRTRSDSSRTPLSSIFHMSCSSCIVFLCAGPVSPFTFVKVTTVSPVRQPMRWRNHSRATKIGVRMWNRNELCSNGVPWRSRIRNLISPLSRSSMSSRLTAKLTRAELTTDRSLAMASSRRTKPWSNSSSSCGLSPGRMSSPGRSPRESVTGTPVRAEAGRRRPPPRRRDARRTST